MNLDNERTINIINAPEKSCYTTDIIVDILKLQSVNASYGHKFTGRPVTELICSNADLIKIKTEYNFAEHEARLFIEKSIKKERELKIHHPLKTWFLIIEKEEEGDKLIRIANISPLLQPLHQANEVLALNSKL